MKRISQYLYSKYLKYLTKRFYLFTEEYGSGGINLKPGFILAASKEAPQKAKDEREVRVIERTAESIERNE